MNSACWGVILLFGVCAAAAIGYAIGFLDREGRGQKILANFDINEDDYITDGLGNYWTSYCVRCGRKSMYVLRPGDARCKFCDDGGID